MFLLAYLGPDTMLPMTSVLAAAAGFVMMFGRKMVDIVMIPFRRKANASAAPAQATRVTTRARGHRPTSARPMASLPANTAAPFPSDDETPAGAA